MNIERTTQGWRVSDIIRGYRVSKHYIGYTKKEAKTQFKEEFKEETKCHTY